MGEPSDHSSRAESPLGCTFETPNPPSLSTMRNWGIFSCLNANGAGREALSPTSKPALSQATSWIAGSNEGGPSTIGIVPPGSI